MKQFKYIQWVLPAVLLSFITASYLTIQHETFERETIFLLWNIFGIVQIILFWFFIGLETKAKKTALIAGTANCLMLIIYFFYIKYTQESRESFYINLIYELLNNLTILIPLFIFGYLTFKNIKKRTYFILLNFIVINGVFAVFYTKKIIKLISNIFRMVELRVFRNGSILSYENGDTTYHLDQSFMNGFILLIKILIFVFIYKTLKDDSLKKNVVNIKNQMSKLKMTFIIITLYTTIFFLSFGIINKIITSLSYKEQFYPLGILHLYYELTFSVMALFIISWIYRKILVEYYLSHHKKISWNYYFLHFPIIGIFVWIFNLFTFIKPEKNDSEVIEKIKMQDNSGIVILGIIVALLPFIKLQGITDAFIILISILFLLLFYFYKYGIYVNIVLNVLIFFVLVYIQYYNLFEIPSGMISLAYFASLAYLIFLYPIFHLTEFDIEVVDAT